jgi:DNA-binding transcriptional ArsR family regulator
VISFCRQQEIAVEIIAQLFRALANHVRLQMLRLLAVLDACSVTDTAAATGQLLSAVSAHYRVLAASGLVWRQRSGRRTLYRLASHPSRPTTRRTLDELRDVFCRVNHTDPVQIVQADQSDSPERSDAALFDCFTAFTHPRRLQILRHLAEHPAASASELAVALRMSTVACHRHVDKLLRRKIVRSTKAGRRIVYQLASGGRGCQGRIVRAVIDALTGEGDEYHTS